MTAAIIAACVLFVCCAVLTVLWFRASRGKIESSAEIARLQNDLENANLLAAQREQHLQSIVSAKDEAHARELDSVSRQCQQRLNDKDAFVAKSIETLREQFAKLAAEKLADRSQDLTRANSEQLENALKPLREQIDSLQNLTAQAQTHSDNLEKSFKEEVGKIGDVARSLSATSDALKGNIKVQGRAGEDILEEKLRQAGLEKNVSFFLQEGFDDIRPDAQVCDPQNRWVIIDSKVNLSDFFAYADETDATKRGILLEKHVAAVKKQIIALAGKNYPMRFTEKFPDRDYIPTTVMFVPYEAPLSLAIEHDPTLVQFATDRKIVLVTPLTLLAYLRLIYMAWQHEKERKSQIELVKVARELLFRTNKFLSVFEDLGKGLKGVCDKYDAANKVFVDTGNSRSIAKSAQKLIDLGVSLESPRGGESRPTPAACLDRNCDDSDGGEEI